MRDNYYLAQVPEQVKILGFSLYPLSLGHIILLNRVESAYVLGGVPDFDDLAISVLICSQRYKDALNLFNDPQLPEFMRRWHDRLTECDRLSVRLGFKKPKLIDFSKESEMFRDYIYRNSKTPNYINKENSAQPMDCPTVQAIKVALMRELGIMESDIFDRSWLICLWDFITLKAYEGHIKMVDEEKIEQAKSIGANLLDLVKQGKIKIPEARGVNGHP